MATETLEAKLDALREYSACDVSDALLKLQDVAKGDTPRAGFLADIAVFSPSTANVETLPKVVAPASTFKFIHKAHNTPEDVPEENKIPAGTHWVDGAQPGTIVLIDQPVGQYCAVLGGIMAARMKVLGVEGVVVNGRVRDLGELRSTNLQVWARGTSTVGTGAEARPLARDVPINFGGVIVSPGDIVFCEPQEGTVVVPSAMLDDVLKLMPKLVPADDKVKEDVLKGSTVFEAFKKHR